VIQRAKELSKSEKSQNRRQSKKLPAFSGISASLQQAISGARILYNTVHDSAAVAEGVHS